MRIFNTPYKKSDFRAFKILEPLVLSDLAWLGRTILKLVRFYMQDQTIRAEQGPQQPVLHPTGPYLTRRKNRRGDLLVFVPRRLNSLLIDDFTGAYGYSHVAVDTGQIDGITRKPVMVESMVGKLVRRNYQDEYGERPFVRIPLSQTGLDTEKFCDCIEGKIGEPYDDLEALTWGMVDDPAKQICSDMVAVCLPDEVRSDIAKASRKGLLRRHSVSIHSLPSTHGLREFISPNAFAEYYGAPPGKDVKQPDQPVSPRLPQEQPVTVKTGRILAGREILGVPLRNFLLIGAAALVGGTIWLMERGEHSRPAAPQYTPQPGARSYPAPVERTHRIPASPEWGGRPAA